MVRIVTLNCQICHKEYQGPEPYICCSGRECGCMGMPTEPIVCSRECYDKMISDSYKEYVKSRINDLNKDSQIL